MLLFYDNLVGIPENGGTTADHLICSMAVLCFMVSGFKGKSTPTCGGVAFLRGSHIGGVVCTLELHADLTDVCALLRIQFSQWSCYLSLTVLSALLGWLPSV